MKNQTLLQRELIAAIKLAGPTSSVGKMSSAGIEGHLVLLYFSTGKTSTRADGDIALSANNALAWQIQIPLDAVEVEVEQGFVTLSGTLDTETQRQCAVDAVRNVAGATGVSNCISLRPIVSGGT